MRYSPLTLRTKWLAKHAYSTTSQGASLIDQTPVSLADLTVPWAHKTPQKYLHILRNYGALVVTGGPSKAEDTLKIVHSQFSKVRHLPCL